VIRFLTDEWLDFWFTYRRARWCFVASIAALAGVGIYGLYVTGV
jgi:hypothetical protein